MVHAPSRFTFAAHDVFRLKSRSVAVMVSRSLAASKRKLERMGIVVLRSTTPCVAVSSLSNSNLLTLISIAVPWIAPVASAAIIFHLGVASCCMALPQGDCACQDVARVRDFFNSLYQIKIL